MSKESGFTDEDVKSGIFKGDLRDLMKSDSESYRMEDPQSLASEESVSLATPSGLSPRQIIENVQETPKRIYETELGNSEDKIALEVQEVADLKSQSKIDINQVQSKVNEAQRNLMERLEHERKCGYKLEIENRKLNEQVSKLTLTVEELMNQINVHEVHLNEKQRVIEYLMLGLEEKNAEKEVLGTVVEFGSSGGKMKSDGGRLVASKVVRAQGESKEAGKTHSEDKAKESREKNVSITQEEFNRDKERILELERVIKENEAKIKDLESFGKQQKRSEAHAQRTAGLAGDGSLIQPYGRITKVVDNESKVPESIYMDEKRINDEKFADLSKKLKRLEEELVSEKSRNLDLERQIIINEKNTIELKNEIHKQLENIESEADKYRHSTEDYEATKKSHENKIEELTEACNRYQESLVSEKRKLDFLQKETETRVSEMIRKNDALEKELIESKTSVESLKKAKEDAGIKFKEECKSFEEQLIKEKSKNNNLKTTNESLLNELNDNYRKLEKEFSEEKIKGDDLLRAKMEYENKIQELTKAHSHEYKELENELKKARRENEHLLSEKVVLDDEIKKTHSQIGSEIVEVRNFNDKLINAIETLRATESDQKAELEKERIEVKRLTEILLEKTKEEQSLKENMKESDRKAKALSEELLLSKLKGENIEADLTEKTHEIQKVVKELKDVQSNLAGVEKQLEIKQANVESLRKAMQDNEEAKFLINKQLLEVTAKNDEISAELEAEKFKFVVKLGEIEKLTKVKAMLQEQIDERNKQVKKLFEDLSKANQAAEEQSRIIRESQHYSTLVDAKVTENEKEIAELKVRLLAESANLTRVNETIDAMKREKKLIGSQLEDLLKESQALKHELAVEQEKSNQSQKNLEEQLKENSKLKKSLEEITKETEIHKQTLEDCYTDLRKYQFLVEEKEQENKNLRSESEKLKQNAEHTEVEMTSKEIKLKSYELALKELSETHEILAADFANLQQSSSITADHLESLKSDIIHYESALKDKEADKKILIIEIEELKRSSNGYQEMLHSATEEIKSYEQKIRESKIMIEVKENIEQQLRMNLTSLEDELAAAKTENNVLAGKNEDLEKCVEAYHQEKLLLEKSFYDEKAKATEQFNSDLNRLKGEFEYAKRSLNAAEEELKERLEILAVQKSRLGALENEILRLNTAIQEKEQAIQINIANISNSAKLVAELMESQGLKETEIQHLRTEVFAFQTEITHMNESLRLLHSEKEALKNEIQRKEAEILQIEAQRDLFKNEALKYRNEIKSLTKEHHENMEAAELSKLEAIQKVKTQYKHRIRLKEAHSSQIIEGLRKELEVQRRRTEEFESNLETIDQLKGELRFLSDQNNSLMRIKGSRVRRRNETDFELLLFERERLIDQNKHLNFASEIKDDTLKAMGQQLGENYSKNIDFYSSLQKLYTAQKHHSKAKYNYLESLKEKISENHTKINEVLLDAESLVFAPHHDDFYIIYLSIALILLLGAFYKFSTWLFF